jgi:hypothetical protein
MPWRPTPAGTAVGGARLGGTDAQPDRPNRHQTLRVVDTGAPDAARTVLLFNGIGTRLETAAPFIAGFGKPA